MKAEKDKKTEKWLIQYRYTDWQGKRRKSTKRGFATKREAEEWLRNFLITQKADFDMKFEDFWKMYYADMHPPFLIIALSLHFVSSLYVATSLLSSILKC